MSNNATGHFFQGKIFEEKNPQENTVSVLLVFKVVFCNDGLLVAPYLRQDSTN